MGVDDGDEDRECGRCHETMHIPPGAEPSEFCHDCAHSLVDELRAERDQFKAMWERDSTALGKALAQRDTARTDAEDKRARVAELEATVARYRQYEYVEARHDETGRSWFGARYNIPERFHEVSNESGVPGPTARDAGNKSLQRIEGE